MAKNPLEICFEENAVRIKLTNTASEMLIADERIPLDGVSRECIENAKVSLDRCRVCSKAPAQTQDCIYHKIFIHLLRLAITDPMTGLFNRRFMEMELLELIKAENNRREALKTKSFNNIHAVVMADFDHFKHINDKYGHLIGDRALQVVAAHLRRNIKASDELSRYGGEEFMAIMFNTDPQGLVHTCERLRNILENQVTAELQAEIPNFDTVVTATFGISCSLDWEIFENDRHTVQLMVGLADDCVYRGKKLGRNTVVFANKQLSLIYQQLKTKQRR